MIGDDGVDRRFQHRPDRPERTIRRHWDRVSKTAWCVLSAAAVVLGLLCLAVKAFA